MIDPPSEFSAPIVKFSGLQVDFDLNITRLYKAITECNWDDAIKAAERNPDEAKTWVVRHHDETDSEGEEREIMWRFLPIHSACARKPPAAVVAALLQAYPEGVKCIDDQGMYPLHYACGNQASREVIRMLLMAFPDAAKLKDPRGMLPIHYLACWGPSSISAIDMVLVANRDVADAKDEDGNTPLDLAMEGEYPERDAVVSALQRWMSSNSSSASSTLPPLAPASKSPASAMRNVISVETAPEEKKEEPETVPTPSRANLASPRKITALQREIEHLQKNQKGLEDAWEGRLNAQSQSYQVQLQMMQKKLQHLESEVSEGNHAIRELETELRSRDKELDVLRLSLDQARQTAEQKSQLLDRAHDERDGLRQTLADLTESHDNFKKKSELLSDRLGSLNASLYGLLEKQKFVVDAMKAREEQWASISKLREAKLKELLALEEVGTDEELELSTAMEKQGKEMEALKAIIAAYRQSEV